ncbi:unnamed protein product [Clonostachys solani]|uniref:Succinate-semialdehyde dehydrogenase, mitochondrial n=1 Tax=Clonostachys solani TaxID=160281 RepID=A0A9N9W528_9HYPO|nr:unnamed protein product [Clonostachys solani]
MSRYKHNLTSCIEPSTATVLGNVANCNLDDFQKAIKSAEIAQQEYYENTSASQRGVLLRKWYDLVIANQDDLAVILCLENGKTISEARGEIIYAASFILWFSEEAPRAYGHTIPSSLPDTTLMSTREPIGVCGIITPWNFPAAMITRKVAPALAAGCSVVVKPPSETPYSCAAFSKLAIDAGIPARIFQICPTKDRQAATELATNPIVRKISFTGSTGVGKLLAKLASQSLKKLSLELGGNAAFIVFDDADLDVAVEGAIQCKFRCSGQTCVCANRLFVQRNVAAEFTRKLTERVSQLKNGPGLDPSVTQGPLVNRSAVDKVIEHINDAVSKGAKVELGGNPLDNNPGFFFPPTILSGVPKDAMVAGDETFGPLAPIFTFDTEEEVIKMANSTEFGLASYLFSENVNRCMRVSKKIQAGMVGVNTGRISASEAPFGGIKESGYGTEGSLYGMEEYQVIKSTIIGNTHR